MLQIIRDFLKTFIFVELGAGTARCFAEYFEYQKYKGTILTSAPWYTGIVVTMILTAIVVAVSFIIWLILGYIIKKKSGENSEKETL